MDSDQQFNMTRLWAGDLTTAQRNTMASTGFTKYYRVPCWINDSPSKTLRAQNLDTPLQIQLDLDTLQNVIQTDGNAAAATATLNITLWIEGRIPTEAERDTTASVINSKDGQLIQLIDSLYQDIYKSVFVNGAFLTKIVSQWEPLERTLFQLICLKEIYINWIVYSDSQPM